MAITAGSAINASDFVGASSGAGDSGKVAKLNASGLIPLGFLALSQSEVHASRAMGTNYQNTSGHVMVVVATCVASAGTSINTAAGYIGASNPATLQYSGGMGGASGSGFITVIMVVPNNYYYRMDAVIGCGALAAWWEVLLPF